MEIPVSYSLLDNKGNEIENGKGRAQIDNENLTVFPEFNNTLFLPLREIIKIDAHDYRIFIALVSGNEIIFSNLGYKFEDFLRIFSRLRNELLLKDTLMQESLKKSGVEAEFIYLNEKGEEEQKDGCELRLYETAIVIIPKKNEIKRIPFCDIINIEGKDFKLVLALEAGGTIFLSKMGNQFDSVKKVLSDLINQLSLQVQSHLQELLPKIDPFAIRKVSVFMKEGKAAKRSDIESVSPEFWTQLETKLISTEIKDEYDFLESLSRKNKMCIGLKRGLMGSITGEYIWFLMPIYNISANEPGNAVAMESILSEEGAGKATYFFRFVSRKDYPGFKRIEDLDEEMDNFIKIINRCMLEINFRREPIYLTDDKLEEPKYLKYRIALQKIPELQTLRNLFIGRVIHASLDQWKQDIINLLEFNISTTDDTIKWRK